MSFFKIKKIKLKKIFKKFEKIKKNFYFIHPENSQVCYRIFLQHIRNFIAHLRIFRSSERKYFWIGSIF